MSRSLGTTRAQGVSAPPMVPVGVGLGCAAISPLGGSVDSSLGSLPAPAAVPVPVREAASQGALFAGAGATLVPVALAAVLGVRHGLARHGHCRGLRLLALKQRGRSAARRPPARSPRPVPKPKPEIIQHLPRSELASTAAALPGESQSQRVQRLIREDFDLETAPKPLRGELSPLVLGALGMQKLRAAEGPAARKLFAQAVMAFPKDAETLFNMGLFYEVAHEQKKMVRWMDMAIECDPDQSLAWIMRSRYMENSARYAEALAGYEVVLKMQPENAMATSQRAGILGNQKLRIEALSSWPQAAEVIRADSPASVIPAWQENFVRPQPTSQPKQALLDGSGIMAWDNVLSKELLSKLDASVEDYYNFAFTNGWVYNDGDGAGDLGTCWLPSSASPETAAELAARTLLQRILQEEPEDFAGIEYWSRVRSENLGAGLHYDAAEDDVDLHGEWLHGNPWRPQWSSVLYLTDEGGPTVILDQLSSEEGSHVPQIPQKGHFCLPKRNRFVVFRADLFHGTLPVELETARSRRVFIFNFWRRHTPAAPHCQRVDFARHVGMRRAALPPRDLDRLRAAEAKPRAPPRPVKRQVFKRPEEMPHSSDFGRLPSPLPMPRAKDLLSSTGLCQLDWAAAAAAAAAGSGNPDRKCPGAGSATEAKSVSSS